MLRLIKNSRLIRKLHPSNTLILKQRLHSLFPNITIPNINLEEYIWENVHKWHDKTALVCAETKRSYTYMDLHRKTNVMANFLHKFNKIEKSDTIAIVLPNLPEYAIILLGAIQAGCKVTTINPYFTAGEISKLLLLTEAKLVFTTTEMYNTVCETLRMARLEIPIIALKSKEESALPDGVINFNDILKQPSGIQLISQYSPDDTILLPFSSGTTGTPKGVELTNRNIVSCLHMLTRDGIDHLMDANETEQEVMPVILPMCHIYGIVGLLLHGLVNGSKMVMLPKFNFESFKHSLTEYKPTVLYLVPPIFHMLLNNDEVGESHLAYVKNIVSAAACLGASEIELLNEKVNRRRINFLQGYGLTESSGLTHLQCAGIKNGIKSGGVGVIMPSTEVKIISPDKNKELATNEEGELWIRGPQMLKGYYKNEKAYKDAFTDDKWFKTGDVGYYDEDGQFFITSRVKDLIKVKGFQVAPAELEELLRLHPDVEDVAVAGIPHEKYGEVPKAFIVRKRNSKITESALKDYVQRKVVNYKQLTGGVAFTEFIPKSPTGKILRRLLPTT